MCPWKKNRCLGCFEIFPLVELRQTSYEQFVPIIRLKWQLITPTNFIKMQIVDKKTRNCIWNRKIPWSLRAKCKPRSLIRDLSSLKKVMIRIHSTSNNNALLSAWTFLPCQGIPGQFSTATVRKRSLCNFAAPICYLRRIHIVSNSSPIWKWVLSLMM